MQAELAHLVLPVVRRRLDVLEADFAIAPGATHILRGEGSADVLVLLLCAQSPRAGGRCEQPGRQPAAGVVPAFLLLVLADDQVPARAAVQVAAAAAVRLLVLVGGGRCTAGEVLRVGDVVVRVDHDNVEGQPLSTLRSRILGGQGTYVTLGFRRREGMEVTYYDVPLMRGSPEYFESLKATQPLQDEIERLKRQNSHLEAQRAQDAAELQRYRQHMEQQRQEFNNKVRVI